MAQIKPFHELLLHFKRVETGLPLAISLTVSLTIALVVAITPNVAVTQHYANLSQKAERARIEREHATALDDARRKLRSDTFAELLSAASDVVISLYPPGAAPQSGASRSSVEVLSAERKFEGLYWGRLGLVYIAPVEPCLTSLHFSLLKAASGLPPSSVPSQSLLYFQTKLDALARVMRDDDPSNDGSIGHAPGRVRALDRSCRPT